VCGEGSLLIEKSRLEGEERNYGLKFQAGIEEMIRWGFTAEMS
jgi:hypothetical protein